jgi:hypothetical protein
MEGLYLTFTSTTRQEFLDAALAKHYNRRQRGWVTLRRDFAPPGGTRPYEVMGLQLPPAAAHQALCGSLRSVVSSLS